MGMIDVGQKPKVARSAIATGEINLKPSTITAIREGRIKKGDPLLCAEIAGILAAKRTSSLLPHCHQIPLDQVELAFQLNESKVEVRCQVKAHWNTGVEMEALVGLTTALNTIWDMVKYLEKDEKGQYPTTYIGNIRVIEKIKSET